MTDGSLQGVWENLIYDSHIKTELLRFVETSLLLSDRKVDTNIVGCNRSATSHLYNWKSIELFLSAGWFCYTVLVCRVVLLYCTYLQGSSAILYLSTGWFCYTVPLARAKPVCARH